MAHSVRLWLETRELLGSNPGGSDVCYRGCAYTVLQTVQMSGVCSDVYGTVHYKESLKLFDKSRAYSLLLSRYAMIMQKAM